MALRRGHTSNLPAASTILSWALIVLCGVGTLVSLAINIHDPAYFDADTASEMVLADALLKSHHIVLTPTFSYSTELQVLSSQLPLEAGLAVMRNNWAAARLIGTALLMVALVASYRYVARQLGIWEQARWLAGALLLPFGSHYARFFILGTYYVPELCAQFLIIGLCLRAMRQRDVSVPLVVGASLVAFGFGTNGYRVTLLCCVPAVLALLWGTLAHGGGHTLAQRLRGLLSAPPGVRAVAAAVLLSSCAGTLLNMFVFSNVFAYQKASSLGLAPFVPSEVLDFVGSGFVETWGYSGAQEVSELGGLGALCSFAVASLVLIATFVCVRRRHRLDWPQRRYVLFCLLSIAMSVAAYYVGGHALTRYLVLSIVPLIVTIPLAWQTMEDDPIVRRAVTAFVMVCMVVQGCAIWYGRSFEHWSSRQPYAKEQVATWLVEQGYREGVATYWNANDTIEMSDGKLDIWTLRSSVSDDGTEQLTEWMDEVKSHQWLEERRHVDELPQGRVFLLLRDFEAWQVLGIDRVLGAPVAAFREGRQVAEGEAVIGDEEYFVFSYGSIDDLRKALTGAQS